MIFINSTELESGEKPGAARVMTFLATRDMHGLESRYVTEIIGMKIIAELPGMPSHIKGIIELDGKIIPVIDVRNSKDRAISEPYNKACIVVIEISATRIGLLADNIADVIATQQ